MNKKSHGTKTIDGFDGLISRDTGGGLIERESIITGTGDGCSQGTGDI